MKNRKKKTIVIVIILCIAILIWLMNSLQYDFLQDDVLFFELFSSLRQSENEFDNLSEKNDLLNDEMIKTGSTTNLVQQSSKMQNGNNMEFIFDVEYKNTKLEDINLLDTVDNKTLVYEKIAPGTSGNFDIVLKSNQQLNYKIGFESQNQKPTNLQFYTSENPQRYKTLEELGETLNGTILPNEEDVVHICWEWCYETNGETDAQDTLDVKTIQEYNFLIYVQGE